MPSLRSEEHTSELQSLRRISYAVFCLKKKKPVTLIGYRPNARPRRARRVDPVADSVRTVIPLRIATTPTLILTVTMVTQILIATAPIRTLIATRERYRGRERARTEVRACDPGKGWLATGTLYREQPSGCERADDPIGDGGGVLLIE